MCRNFISDHEIEEIRKVKLGKIVPSDEIYKRHKELAYDPECQCQHHIEIVD